VAAMLIEIKSRMLLPPKKVAEGAEAEDPRAALVRRLLSDDYADKVIVTTIQKLGLALDENSKRNKQQKKDGKATYKEQLAHPERQAHRFHL